LSAGRAADLGFAGEPELRLRSHCRTQGLGHDLGQSDPDLRGGEPLAGLYGGVSRGRDRAAWRAVGGGAPRGALAPPPPPPAAAEERVSGEQGSNHYFYAYLREVLSAVGLLSILKPRPDMPDAEATVEAITRECVLHGSPRTVLDKLVAFRDAVGPFGTLLMT